ncbi:MAG: TerB family tellurite resistance protein [Bacteroidales bacterium]|nr:TerB family tellurite resistance protein [Bacteroidales bacterium]
MGAGKWIGGILGWVTLGPIGALLGILAGSVIEGAMEAGRMISGEASGSGRTFSSGGTGRSYSAAEQRNSFLVSLLVLASAVIKADGLTHPKEIELVKDFIRRSFGEASVAEAMRILDRLNTQQVNIYEVGEQIASYMNYSQRLQLFHFLVQIATADGSFDKNEKSVLEAIARAIHLSPSDAASVIAMFYKDTESAYAVLEISPSATDDEVKTAYRRMAMKNHPDKVATLGPDVQKAAEEKFRKIQEAYETIKKERGIN